MKLPLATTCASILAMAIGSRVHAQTHVFEPVVASLHQKTEVPLRVPRYLPDVDDSAHLLYANVLPGSSAGYEVEIGWTPDCVGETYCHYGIIYGSKRSIRLNGGRHLPVRLAHGIRGTFVDAACGASCDDSTIFWSQDGYFYAIGLKAGTLAELKQVVNSAIEDADRKSRTATTH